MQNRPLKRSPIETLFSLQQSADSLFSQVPSNLLHKINHYHPDWQNYEKALQHVANGELEGVEALLNAKPHLVLFNGGRAVTPAGLTLADPDQSLLECALGAGDPEMVALITPFYSKFEGGDDKKEKQLARYTPLIEAMQKQIPDDLTWLIKIIKDSPMADVLEELKEGKCYINAYNCEYKSTLREGLNKFRDAKLDSDSRILTKPRMHCKYQNLIHAFQLLEREWNVLIHQDYYKNRLVWRQIIGLIAYVELPAHEREIFGRNGIKAATHAATHGQSCKRLRHHSDSNDTFPKFNAAALQSRSGGVGFCSGIDRYGEGKGIEKPNWGNDRLDLVGTWCNELPAYVDQKASSLQKLCSQNRKTKGNGLK
jgi:hypothetical protein